MSGLSWPFTLMVSKKIELIPSIRVWIYSAFFSADRESDEFIVSNDVMICRILLQISNALTLQRLMAEENVEINTQELQNIFRIRT